MYYGFDIGGTKIALGVFDKQRRLQWETRVPTPRDSYDAFLDAVCNLVTEADHTKTLRTAAERPSSMVKRRRDQSTEAPRARIWSRMRWP